MIFNSLTFLIFLCIVWGLYYILPARGRIWLLMVASLTFYGFWRVEFLAVLLLSAFTDFLVSIQLSKVSSQLHRRLLVALSLIVNLGLLAYFKYLYFIVENLNVLAQTLGFSGSLELWDIILPLGISFYTFQTISYTIDVYRGHTEPVSDFVVYTTYVTFFPQLIAGPVLRASEVIGQLQAMPTPKVEDIIEGLRRITLGLFLKVGLADNIAPLVDDGFMVPMDSLGALDVWTLTFLFGFQIYFDFSAYSSIAIGCARLLGIQFPENFNFPYFATGARDFWKRWHISLSSWIRDYLYLPLTGAKVTNDGSRGGLGVTELKRDRALILTWLIMGLWHGASWTFVLWGAFHALWVLSERWLKPLVSRFPKFVRSVFAWPVTLLVAMAGWIPFRVETVSESLKAYAILLNPNAYFSLGLRENTYLVAALVMTGMIIVRLYYQWLSPKLQAERFGLIMAAASGGFFGVIVFFDLIFLRPITQFIYFQF